MSEGEGAVRPNQERWARAAGSRLYVALGVVVAILFVAGGVTLPPRRAQYPALAGGNQTNAIPTVALVSPTAAPPPEELLLPGTPPAFLRSPIYPPPNRHLEKRY